MTDDSPDKHASLIAAHHARLKAVLDSDTEALSKVVAEDMIYVSSHGAIQTRPEVFAAFQSGALKVARMVSSNISTRIYGDTGILIYQADAKMVDGVVTVEGATRSTTIYVKYPDGWKMVSQHQSRIE
jgi:ketosteroid isomerase-like protein